MPFTADWTYAMRITLELYRLPYPELVISLRAALRHIWDEAAKLEAIWQSRQPVHLSSNKQPVDGFETKHGFRVFDFCTLITLEIVITSPEYFPAKSSAEG